MTLETAHINVIAIHPTADTAAPAVPSKGANLAVALWGSGGFVTIGSTPQKLHDANLDSESITLEIEPGLQPVRAPIGMAPGIHRYTGSFMLPWEFQAREISQTLHELASNMQIASSKSFPSEDVTPRTVIVEYNKHSWVVIPIAYLMMTSIPGSTEGEDGVGMTTFMVFPEEHSVYKGGYYKQYYS